MQLALASPRAPHSPYGTPFEICEWTVLLKRFLLSRRPTFAEKSLHSDKVIYIEQMWQISRKKPEVIPPSSHSAFSVRIDRSRGKAMVLGQTILPSAQGYVLQFMQLK